VDHVDGLADPEGYLDRLRGATGGGYVVVEKILAAGEELPGSWATAGTSGYDFLNAAGQLMVDPAGEATLRDGYARFTGVTWDMPGWPDAVKLEIMRDDLAAEVERLTELLDRVCEATGGSARPYPAGAARGADRVIAGFGVYRPYARPGGPPAPRTGSTSRRPRPARAGGTRRSTPSWSRSWPTCSLLRYPGPRNRVRGGSARSARRSWRRAGRTPRSTVPCRWCR
jgi:(1->4)-alpha-D-glucan 1-alpha-D-glucosylmutase